MFVYRWRFFFLILFCFVIILFPLDGGVICTIFHRQQRLIQLFSSFSLTLSFICVNVCVSLCSFFCISFQVISFFFSLMLLSEFFALHFVFHCFQSRCIWIRSVVVVVVGVGVVVAVMMVMYDIQWTHKLINNTQTKKKKHLTRINKGEKWKQHRYTKKKKR